MPKKHKFKSCLKEQIRCQRYKELVTLCTVFAILLYHLLFKDLIYLMWTFDMFLLYTVLLCCNTCC